MPDTAKEQISKDQAIERYGSGFPARLEKGRWVRDGNWVELSRALRHADCKDAVVTVVDQDGSTILEIQPVPVDPPPGKSKLVRPAFALIVT